MPPRPNPPTLSPVPEKTHSPPSPLAPHFDDPPDTHNEHPDSHQPEDAAFDADDEIPYPEPSSEHTLLPPPNFSPFFTIVEDTTTGDHHHPFVHYVFTDDDPVIVTAAAMRSLGLDDTKYLQLPDAEGKEHIHDDEEEDDHEPIVESPLPPPIVGSKERFMIIDVAADGRTIAGAQSMSPDWQITNANVRTAPSFDEGAPDRGFMLKIEGLEVPRKNKGKAKGQAGETKLKEAQERSKGDIFGALDGLVRAIEGSLEFAGKVSGQKEERFDFRRTSEEQKT
ncbi:hypothetical protein K458DRAFT_437995 [Lentithecium fluviatile CBS 122367]|uniref:Uncharacterized protein n=1 Tax=Lentithecium fluviatile CBS 122367 TaxID=1168545 RepID=A0A6G1JLZ1_9PLEO|nr:hypothetical protein K458DRAFT_437995 [Lentithecium fluviatile CBS 122367]